MKIRFDRDLITDQMNALGVSERAVISQSGIPNFTFRRARQTGEFDGTTTLRQVHALAGTLGLTISQLLATPAETPHIPCEQSAKQDAADLIPLLVDIPKMVAVHLVSQSIGWKRGRLDAALDAIPALLEGTGLRLHQAGGAIKIVPVKQQNSDLKRALGRLRTLGLGLNTTQAAVLTRIIDGNNVLDRMPSSATRIAVGALKNMGYIALNDDAVFEPSDDLLLALPDS